MSTSGPACTAGEASTFSRAAPNPRPRRAGRTRLSQLFTGLLCCAWVLDVARNSLESVRASRAWRGRPNRVFSGREPTKVVAPRAGLVPRTTSEASWAKPDGHAETTNERKARVLPQREVAPYSGGIKCYPCLRKGRICRSHIGSQQIGPRVYSNCTYRPRCSAAAPPSTVRTGSWPSPLSGSSIRHSHRG
jgi:hypothetical protein